MLKWSFPLQPKHSWLPAAAGLLLTAAAVAFGILLNWTVAALILVGLGWAAVYFLYRSLNQSRAQLAQAARRHAVDEQRLQALLHFNRSLTQVENEQALMDVALATLTELVGALGCSFVPVDEWQQPLPAFTYGQLPAPVLSAWSTHLANNMLRERCGACQVLEIDPRGLPAAPCPGGRRADRFLPAAQPHGG